MVKQNNKTKDSAIDPKLFRSKTLHNLSKALRAFSERNQLTSNVNYKVYHLLCQPFTFVNAYSKFSKNKGAYTLGYKDENIMEFFGKLNAQAIANKFRKGSYLWKPVRRTWIPKQRKNTLRPIDTPTQEDRIVQEAIRGILESIFEPEFKEFESLPRNNGHVTNYGFRPEKSTQMAVESLKLKGSNNNMVLEGDISSAYNSVNHSVMIHLLKRRIKDKKFLGVISKMLKSGVMDRERYQHNLTGTPQGGIVSPLLFNIYMFEFDKFIYRTILTPISYCNVLKGKRKQDKRAKQITNFIKNNKDKLNRKELKQLVMRRASLPSYDVKTLPRGCHYVRFADDWVLLLTASKSSMESIKSRIASFLSHKLKFKLDPNKTAVTAFNQSFQFLGFSIRQAPPRSVRLKRLRIRSDKKQLRLRRTTRRHVTIIPDSKRIKQRLIYNLYCDSSLSSRSHPHLVMLTPYEIVLHYQLTMRGLFNYYARVDNFNMINYAFYILRYSCAKTIARRQKSSIRKVFDVQGLNLETSIVILTHSGEQVRSVRLPSLPDLKRGLNNRKTKVRPYA